jgi:hypothetical protein
LTALRSRPVVRRSPSSAGAAFFSRFWRFTAGLAGASSTAAASAMPSSCVGSTAHGADSGRSVRSHSGRLSAAPWPDSCCCWPSPAPQPLPASSSCSPPPSCRAPARKRSCCLPSCLRGAGGWSWLLACSAEARGGGACEVAADWGGNGGVEGGREGVFQFKHEGLVSYVSRACERHGSSWSHCDTPNYTAGAPEFKTGVRCARRRLRRLRVRVHCSPRC